MCGTIAVHLAEELKDAAYMLPRAMISSALINYATALTMIISLVSAIDPDILDDILATTTGQPWVSPSSNSRTLCNVGAANHSRRRLLLSGR